MAGGVYANCTENVLVEHVQVSSHNNDNDNNNKHAMPVKLNNFTHLRALLELHDCRILAHVTSVTAHHSSN
jgi:hypothetical protein